MSLSNVARASRRGFLAAVALSALAAFPATAQMLVEGQHYTRIKNPQPVGSGKKIEVLEFFSYGCPHCRDLDPELVAWQKTIPADVEFRRVPVDYGREQWAVLAKAYYTYSSFGVTSKFNRSRAIAKDYNVQSVPLVIVDGKFQVSSDKVGSHAAMPAAINQLITKARAERPKS